MIGTVLGQAQKLFGRGFLIAAFVPSSIFVATVSYFLWGYSAIEETVNQWITQGWKQAAFEIILLLMTIYLLAYLIYGIRAAIHQCFQGRWPGPLKPLMPIGLALATRKMRRLEEKTERRANSLDVPAWAMKFHFKETSADVELTCEDAARTLSTIRSSHQSLLQQLKQNEKLKASQEKSYQSILGKARILQSNLDRFSPVLRQEINQLVCSIKTAYNAHLPLRTAVRRMNAVALRRWTTAYNSLSNNFPSDERWLRPTRFGNVMSMLESYPIDRYGINLSDLWPRLLQVITKDARLRIEEANIYLDFMVLMSFLSLLAAIVASAEVFYHPPRAMSVHLLLILLCLLSSSFLYQLAIQAAKTFGFQVQAAVDLFRLKLIDAMQIERPSNPKKEKEIWTEMRYFISQAELPLKNIRFKRPDEKKKKGKTKKATRLKL